MAKQPAAKKPVRKPANIYIVLWLCFSVCVLLFSAAAFYAPPFQAGYGPLSPAAFFEKQQDMVNLNTATKEELAALPGIGPAKAEAIIAYRRQNGPFKDIRELLHVQGIGEKTFEKLSDKICV